MAERMGEAAEAPQEHPPTNAPPTTPSDELRLVPLGEISPYGNIRTTGVDPDAMKELVVSVRQQGIIEPVILKPLSGYAPDKRAKFDPNRKGFHYRLVAGFRRTFAAQQAGLKVVPARIMDLDDAEILEAQLVENMQREDLSPIQEALAFQAYLKETGKVQGHLAKQLGRDQSFVSNRVRLLALSDPVRELVDSGELSSSHAEVLLKIPAEAASVAIEAAKEAAKRGTSVADLNRELSWKVRQHLERVAFEKKVAASKFPKCPTCKKPATEAPGYSAVGSNIVGHGDYSAEHRWRLTDGKLESELRQERAAAERKRSNEERGGPAPKRDLTQPATTRASATPLAIARRVLELAGEKGIAELYLEDTCQISGGLESNCLHVHLTAKAAEGLPHHGSVRSTLRVLPVPYSTGDRSQVTALEQWSGYDSRQRSSAIKSWDTWARKNLPAGKPSTKGVLEADPKLLEGNVSEVLTRLEKGKAPNRSCDRVELVEQLRVLEAKGANRPSVLERMDDWLQVSGAE